MSNMEFRARVYEEASEEFHSSRSNFMEEIMGEFLKPNKEMTMKELEENLGYKIKIIKE